jgi:predicted RNA-binding Zn-ribbon protein involved in translation (DUF1610 family)
MKKGKNKEIIVCAECKSEYFAHTSKMKNLCPECAHVLYGYENCDHQFQNGRCSRCYWDGSVSGYIKKMKSG